MAQKYTPPAKEPAARVQRPTGFDQETGLPITPSARPVVTAEPRRPADAAAAETKEVELECVTVRATATGYYDNRLIETGTVFDLYLRPSETLPKWVESLDEGADVPQVVPTSLIHGTGATQAAEPTPKKAAEGGFTPAEARDPGDAEGNRIAKPGR